MSKLDPVLPIFCLTFFDVDIASKNGICHIHPNANRGVGCIRDTSLPCQIDNHYFAKMTDVANIFSKNIMQLLLNAALEDLN